MLERPYSENFVNYNKCIWLQNNSTEANKNRNTKKLETWLILCKIKTRNYLIICCSDSTELTAGNLNKVHIFIYAKLLLQKLLLCQG